MTTTYNISKLDEFKAATEGKILLVFVANSDESPKRGGGLIPVTYEAFLELLGANGIKSWTVEEIHPNHFALDNYRI